MRDPSKPVDMTAEQELAYEESRLTPEQKRLGDEWTKKGLVEVRAGAGRIVFVFCSRSREAVAETWERVLRARRPDVAWRVTESTNDR